MQVSVVQVTEHNSARLADVLVLGVLKDIVCVFRERRRLFSPGLCAVKVAPRVQTFQHW